ncbi:MAG: haloalkane dehalogenase, partial [Bradymonadaceae bacterium]
MSDDDIEYLRTPEARFSDLPSYDWETNYLEGLEGFGDMRLHYADAGPAEAERTFLCLHGEPTWAYLYRKMIPVFVESGARSVAPDFFGFGRSDKPVDDEVYSFEFHRESMLRVVEQLDLENMTLVCQDWGGLVGLTLPMEMPERFDRMIVMNTGLGTGEAPGKGFEMWLEFVRSQPDLEVGRLIDGAVPTELTDGEIAAYDAPFPDQRYKAGVRTFPELVPTSPDEPGAEVSRCAARWLSDEWSGESFMAIGRQDPVLGPPVMEQLRTADPRRRRPFRPGARRESGPRGTAVFRGSIGGWEPCSPLVGRAKQKGVQGRLECVGFGRFQILEHDPDSGPLIVVFDEGDLA